MSQKARVKAVTAHGELNRFCVPIYTPNVLSMGYSPLGSKQITDFGVKPIPKIKLSSLKKMDLICS